MATMQPPKQYQSSALTNGLSLVFTSLPIMVLLYWMKGWIPEEWIVAFKREILLAAIGGYALFVYLYIGNNSNTVRLYPDSLQIINRVPGFKKQQHFAFTSVRQIQLHSFNIDYWAGISGSKWLNRPLQIILPFFWLFPPYKSICIDADGLHKYCCAGIEDDYFESETDLHFDGLYDSLKAMGINVTFLR